MIDFEIVGDLLRKSKIPHKVVMYDAPVIVAEAEEDCVPPQSKRVFIVFDRGGNLVRFIVGKS